MENLSCLEKEITGLGSVIKFLCCPCYAFIRYSEGDILNFLLNAVQK